MSLLAVVGLGVIAGFWMMLTWFWRSPPQDDSTTSDETH